MVKINYLLCVVLTNLVLIQSCFGGYQRTFTSCNDFKLANGRMRIKPKGRLAKFLCNRGFMLAGEKYSYCIKGKFDVPPPVCVKPTCSKIKQLTNGLILPSYNGGVINFYCKPGFTMRGSNITYCDGTRWSHNLPACISTHTPTPTSCDFETEDLCGWSHDLNHDFDWRREKFQTPSGHIGTGPKHDHTKGMNQDGYYIYTESTSRLENDTARLISPLYPPLPNGLCFTFWYHMYGREMGYLRIFLRRASQQGTSSLVTKPLWTEHGNHGDVWRKGMVAVEEGVNEDFQIIIEGIRGKSYVSDIAVDDVALTESCPDEEIVSSTTDSPDEDTEIYFGSCENRCVSGNNDSTQPDFVVCDCDDLCHERNTCCPDYTIVCLIAPFEASSPDFSFELDSTTEMETSEKYEPTTVVPSTKVIEFQRTTIVELATTLSTKTEIPMQTVTKEEHLTSTREPKIETTTEPVNITTQSISTTVKSIINTSNNTKNNTKTVKPINSNNNTTTEQTIAATTTSVTTKPTTTNRPKINTTKPTKIDKNKNNINKITTVVPKITILINNKTDNKNIKPIVTKVQTASTSSTSKPIPTKSLVITKFPVTASESDEFDRPVKTQTLEIETDYETTEHVSSEPKMQMVSQREKIVKEDNITGDSNLTFAIFGTSAVVLIAIIIAVVIFTKYNTQCSRLRLRNSRNSDSMSDVRFLASDEVLDFTWRTSN